MDMPDTLDLNLLPFARYAGQAVPGGPIGRLFRAVAGVGDQ